MAAREHGSRERQYVAGRPVPDEAQLEHSLRPQPEHGEEQLHDPGLGMSAHQAPGGRMNLTCGSRSVSTVTRWKMRRSKSRFCSLSAARPAAAPMS